MQLKECASVRSGLVLARKQAKEMTQYGYILLNLRSIRQEGSIDLEQTDIYHAIEPLKTEYLSQPGDIVVRLTTPYTAVLIDETTAGMVIASNFVVIRMESEKLLPEYLFWLLNTQEVKRQIYENATSNMLGAVKAKFLAEFELIVPSLDAQNKIAKLNQLSKRESQLLGELIQEKQKYYACVLDGVYKNVKRGK